MDGGARITFEEELNRDGAGKIETREIPRDYPVLRGVYEDLPQNLLIYGSWPDRETIQWWIVQFGKLVDQPGLVFFLRKGWGILPVSDGIWGRRGRVF